MMRAVFRVDASLCIGIGHVMRCLTLANALRARGVECTFLCREHSGHLAGEIRAQGYTVKLLTQPDVGVKRRSVGDLDHAVWLGATQLQDIEVCRSAIEALRPDWLVVDHYALDSIWENAFKDYCRHILVIDDLADRRHSCTVLLDQNLGRKAIDYRALTSTGCVVLLGPQYALLRDEFTTLRSYSLVRRQRPQLKRLLISMGGVDKLNITGRVLDALYDSSLPSDCKVTVVMGGTAPHLALIQAQAAVLPWSVEVCVGVHDIAQRMADSDLCIGAAGGTSWERCCLGLPTLIVVLAANQRLIAEELAKVGAAEKIDVNDLGSQLREGIAQVMKSDKLFKMSQSARSITTGHGAEQVAEILMARGGYI